MLVVSFPLACVGAGLQGISGEIETIGCLHSWQTYCGTFSLPKCFSVWDSLTCFWSKMDMPVKEKIVMRTSGETS